MDGLERRRDRKRRGERRRATALGVVLALALVGGLVAVRLNNHTTPAGTVSSTPTPTPHSSTHPTQRADHCRVSDLRIFDAGSNGAAGTIQATIAIVNESGKTCTLIGYPHLQLLDAQGNLLPTSVLPGRASDAPSKPTLVTLRPGERAMFVLRYSDVGNGPGSCKTASQLRVTPPGDRSFALVPVSITACGKNETIVSPVFTGAPAAPSTPTPTPSSVALPLCTQDSMMKPTLVSQTGAAGTIRSVWRVTNVKASSCRSFGYPGMDFHASRGWLGVTVIRGGYPDINVAPRSVVVAPRQSLYFISYWSDVTTGGTNCRSFDRVKITLPDNFVSLELTATGCVIPSSVRVGPVTTTRPSP